MSSCWSFGPIGSLLSHWLIFKLYYVFNIIHVILTSTWTTAFQLIECPSIYELMPSLDFCWKDPPVLQVWREKNDSSGNLSASLDSHEPVSAISVMKEALSDNTVSFQLVILYHVSRLFSFLFSSKRVLAVWKNSLPNDLSWPIVSMFEACYGYCLIIQPFFFYMRTIISNKLLIGEIVMLPFWMHGIHT